MDNYLVHIIWISVPLMWFTQFFFFFFLKPVILETYWLNGAAVAPPDKNYGSVILLTWRGSFLLASKGTSRCIAWKIGRWWPSRWGLKIFFTYPPRCSECNCSWGYTNRTFKFSYTASGALLVSAPTNITWDMTLRHTSRNAFLNLSRTRSTLCNVTRTLERNLSTF